MPRFQGSLDTVVGSNEWCRDEPQDGVRPNVAAVRKAFTDAGKAVPEGFMARTPGAADVAPPPDGA